MKRIMVFLIFALPVSTFAMSLEEKVKLLEKRVQQLENAQRSSRGQVDKSTGLKVKDMNNQSMQTEMGRGVSAVSQQMPEMTKEQQDEMMKQIELYQKRQKESEEILEQLMKEE